MKGIVLSGGAGSRLSPITCGVSKQLLPVYDKPMIYYPLSVLMMAGIQDILLISTRRDLPIIQGLLGDGSAFGINMTYALQEHPNGIAESYIIGEQFVGNEPSCLILGDNIFYGGELREKVRRAATMTEGCTVFGYRVSNPEDFGVIEFSPADESPVSIEEKPAKPKSNVAVTGLYFYDNDVCGICKSLKPSDRGELEISDVNRVYLDQDRLDVDVLGRGYAWLDSGTPDSLLSASQFVQTIQARQGYYIACLEEIGYQNGWLSLEDVVTRIGTLGNNSYSKYLLEIIK